RPPPEERFREVVNFLDKVGLGDRARGARDALGRFARERLLRGDLLGGEGGLASRFKNLGEYLPLDRLGRGLASGRSALPPAPRVGSWGRPSLSGAPSGGRALLWALAVAVVLLGLWKALRAARGPAAAGKGGWRLGPWPVRPERVASRGDLVRAFEHLACLRLGEDALHRHHLDLGERPGAEELARPYGQAPSAPPDEPLPPAEL